MNTQTDINFMFLLEGAPAPDHSTFARFRNIHFAPCSKRILSEMSKALFDLGEISGETVFIDGTKIEACKTPLQKSIETREDYLSRIKKYNQQIHTCGERNSYSKTDHDATFMRMKEDTMGNGQLYM